VGPAPGVRRVREPGLCPDVLGQLRRTGSTLLVIHGLVVSLLVAAAGHDAMLSHPDAVAVAVDAFVV